MAARTSAPTQQLMTPVKVCGHSLIIWYVVYCRRLLFVVGMFLFAKFDQSLPFLGANFHFFVNEGIAPIAEPE